MQPPGTLLERGVYDAPVLGQDGETIFFSVTSQHRLLRSVRVSDPVDAPAAAAALEHELDEVDPRQLRLAS